MISATRSGNVSLNTHIVSLDVGTSSVRALLFDQNLQQVGRQKSKEEMGAQRTYQISTSQDGSVEIDPLLLLKLTEECLDELHAELQSQSKQVAAIGFSAFWHCFLGVDGNGAPTTPIIHLFDTRSGPQVDQLTGSLDAKAIHARTGCVLHTSYWPAKLLWLRENQREACERTKQWLSFGEFLYLKLFGKAVNSLSMASATGIWNHAAHDYDEELLRVLRVGHDQLSPVGEFDQPLTKLLPEYARRWPLFNGIPWFPAIGDGACNNIGSGCTNQDRFALMVGTSGAMRVVIETDRIGEIPSGIWCYRVDHRRFILGGALSNGGEVFAWMKRTLQLPEDAEQVIAKRTPGSHQLTLQPFFAGERSPYWRPDLRASIVGMSLATKPVDILQAALESVSLRFRQIYDLLSAGCGVPKEVIASGGALVNSPVWTQMMADALAHPVTICEEPEASSRGAALLAAERLGIIKNLDDLTTRLGSTYTPVPANKEIYEQLLERDQRLFDTLYSQK